MEVVPFFSPLNKAVYFCNAFSYHKRILKKFFTKVKPCYYQLLGCQKYIMEIFYLQYVIGRRNTEKLMEELEDIQEEIENEV